MLKASIGATLSAVLVAGLMSLASAGAANAESVMKQCGDEWKAAKAAGTTNGQTWADFRKTCEAQKKGAAAPAAAPAAAAPAATPAAARRRRPGSRGRAGADEARAEEGDDRRRPAPANSPAKPKPRAIAPATPSSGSTPSPTSITSPATRPTAPPRRAPTCAKPTPSPPAPSPPRAKSRSKLTPGPIRDAASPREAAFFVPGLGEPGFREAPLYPASARPVLARRPAGNHGKAGLAEPGYRGGRRVPSLAEAARGETTSRESWKGRARRARLQRGGACTRPRRGRRLRDDRPGIADRPASARPATEGGRLYPASARPATATLPDQSDFTQAYARVS